MAVDLAGKNILITGGSRGLGFAVAQACLRAGGRVVICARDELPLHSAARELEAIAGRDRIEAVAADVTIIADLEAALDRLELKFGRVTSLVHAAAILGPIGEFTAVDPDLWMEAVRIDLFGTFLAARQTCLRLKRDGGRILLFAGGGASGPFPEFSAYAGSKAGVVRLTETIAREMAPYKIEANCLAPGLVMTRMAEQIIESGHTPAASPVSAELGAETAAFLISDSARGITGKFVAAQYDGWREWPQRLDELRDSDLFTLRRIVPRDRGLDWQ